MTNQRNLFSDQRGNAEQHSMPWGLSKICQGCIISRRRVFRGKRAPDFQLFQPVSQRAVTVTNFKRKKRNYTIQR